MGPLLLDDCRSTEASATTKGDGSGPAKHKSGMIFRNWSEQSAETNTERFATTEAVIPFAVDVLTDAV